MPRTPDPEVGGSSPTRVKPGCVLEQGTFTPQKVLVIPRRRWLRPNMTEKCLPGRLESINQPSTPDGYMTRNSDNIAQTINPIRQISHNLQKEAKPAYNKQRSRAESRIIDNLMYSTMNTYTLTQDHSINENPQNCRLKSKQRNTFEYGLILSESPKIMTPNDNAKLAHMHNASTSQHSYLNEKCSMTPRQSTKSPISCNGNDENLKEDGKPSNLKWNSHDESKTDTNMLDNNNPSIPYYSDSHVASIVRAILNENSDTSRQLMHVWKNVKQQISLLTKSQCDGENLNKHTYKQHRNNNNKKKEKKKKKALT